MRDEDLLVEIDAREWEPVGDGTFTRKLYIRHSEPGDPHVELTYTTASVGNQSTEDAALEADAKRYVHGRLWRSSRRPEDPGQWSQADQARALVEWGRRKAPSRLKPLPGPDADPEGPLPWEE